MRAIMAKCLVLTLGLSFAAHGQETAAERFTTLLHAHNEMSGAFRAATTDDERKAAVERLAEFPEQFLDLAEDHASDPIGIRALRQAVQAINSVDSLAQQAWEMNTTAFPAGSSPQSCARAVAILLRDHVRREGIGAVCERMRWAARTEYAPFLEAVVRDNEHRNDRGIAALAWAQVLNNQLHLIDLAADRPDLTARLDAVYGNGFLPSIREPGRDALAREVETRFEQAAEFQDVALPGGGSVGDKVARELYALRHLSIGKPAPDIDGVDQDGLRFKLSDYRGKVVLLYFWMEF